MSRRALTLGFAGVLAIALSSCGQGSGSNVVAIQAGGCSQGYPDEPCVSVTICQPGTSSCQTISNILLDTGSYGLRVFGSLLSVQLPLEGDGSGNKIAECVSYVQQSSDWGPVVVADIQLGGETASSVPMQIIDAGFAQIPSSCQNPDTSPQNDGFNGILGVGLLVQDCGSSCSQSANNQVYYSCGSGGCGGIAIPLQDQVSNPIALLPVDNNGLIINFPAIPAQGVPTVQGTMVLGIGTQGDNSPAQVTVLPADQNSNFLTTFNGQTLQNSFIDSGTDGLFFPSSSIPQCNSSGQEAGFYCPNGLVNFSAIQMGANGSPQVQVPFQVYNAQQALSSSNQVFSDLGGTNSNGFIWGFPFFIGRTIYFGLEGHSSSLGQGPFWAF